MTNIEKVNKALENADESKIKEVLDFLGYKEDSKFIPKHGEQYYVITTFGSVSVSGWRGDEYDNHARLMNNVHRTKEEAEQAVDFQIRKANLIKEIEDSSGVIDWGNGKQYKNCIYYNHKSGSLRVHNNDYFQTQGTTYTTNRQFLAELIETRYDEVKELLFGVK